MSSIGIGTPLKARAVFKVAVARIEIWCWSTAVTLDGGPGRWAGNIPTASTCMGTTIVEFLMCFLVLGEIAAGVAMTSIFDTIL